MQSSIEAWEVAQIITTKLESGFVGVQCVGVGEGAQLGFFIVHHPHGFRSQPLDGADDGTGCGALYGYEGGRGHAWLLADGRYLAALPDEGKGGSIQYAVTVPPGGGEAKVTYLKMMGGEGSAELRVPSTADHVQIQHGDEGPMLEFKALQAALRGPNGVLQVLVKQALVELGGEGGDFVLRATPAFLAWLAAVGTQTGAGAPPADAVSTKVRAVL